MIEDGVYIIKQEFFTLFEGKGCKFKNNKAENRPTFCCMKDNMKSKILTSLNKK